ncbi:phasin family protein [Albidovulum sediminis]|uniref:Phasin family protein n=1 Tax=Albidovulum sediminis TaxID=3066345 RepID=A0ABT2NNN0_9RHOB|nr:phasin family protein [Defluviimonas sediminis]MCT8329698.1 phasin family protein [Defluviimonas sediminis]
MTKQQDFSKVLQDMVSQFPVDTAALKDVYKNSAVLSEKMTKVALEAAEKSNDISSKWAKETIAKFGELSKAKSEPTDYTKAFSDFASASAELAAENLAAFAEVAKKAQTETVELMLAAGKDFSEEATAAVKKATADVQTAAKKAATVATAAAK